MSLSQENINKLVFGGIYTALGTDIEKYLQSYTNRLNDQKYGWWIPVHATDKQTGEDKYYMIDTYQISGDLYENRYAANKEDRYNGLLKGLERLNIPENGGNWASGMPFHYYYSAIVKLTDGNINIFKLKADLHDYRMSNEDECRNYNEEDVIRYLRLYNEHCYSSGGIIVVKKDAKINYKNKIDAKTNDILKGIHAPDSWADYKIEELLEIEKEAIENNAEYNKKKLDATIKCSNFVNYLKKIYNDYMEEIRSDLYSDYEKTELEE